MKKSLLDTVYGKGAFTFEEKPTQYKTIEEYLKAVWDTCTYNSNKEK